ncbi:MAG: hypothetical protein ACWA44_07210 [Thiotrichales bacterium]
MLVLLVLVGLALAWLFISFNIGGPVETAVRNESRIKETAHSAGNGKDEQGRESVQLFADDCSSCTVQRPDDFETFVDANQGAASEQVLGERPALAGAGQIDRKVVDNTQLPAAGERSRILGVERLEFQNLVRVEGQARQGVFAIGLKIGGRVVGPVAVDTETGQWRQDIYLEENTDDAQIVEYDERYRVISNPAMDDGKRYALGSENGPAGQLIIVPAAFADEP